MTMRELAAIVCLYRNCPNEQARSQALELWPELRMLINELLPLPKRSTSVDRAPR